MVLCWVREDRRGDRELPNETTRTSLPVVGVVEHAEGELPLPATAAPESRVDSELAIRRGMGSRGQGGTSPFGWMGGLVDEVVVVDGRVGVGGLGGARPGAPLGLFFLFPFPWAVTVCGYRYRRRSSGTQQRTTKSV